MGAAGKASEGIRDSPSLFSTAKGCNEDYFGVGTSKQGLTGACERRLQLGTAAVGQVTAGGTDVTSVPTWRSHFAQLFGLQVQLPQTADALERRLRAKIASVRSRAAVAVFLTFFMLITSLCFVRVAI